MKTNLPWFVLGVGAVAAVLYGNHRTQEELSREVRELRQVVKQQSLAARRVDSQRWPEVGGQVVIGDEQLRDALASALAERERIAAENGDKDDALLGKEPTSVGAPNEEPPQRVALTQESLVLLVQAEQVVDTALQRGVWREEDKAALHSAMDPIPDGPTQAELMRRVAAAINDGTMRHEFDTPPF